MSYFVTEEFCLLAHRGLSQHREDLDENTLDAFSEALAFGATHLESDIHATKDGVAVLVHDADLLRVAGVHKKVSELELAELRRLRLRSGGQIPTLEEALRNFPEARFNLDLKTAEAIDPTAIVLLKEKAHDRVLLSSFDHATRMQILQKTGHKTATSADARAFLRLFFINLLSPPLAQRVTKDFQALQIPVRRSVLRFDSPRFANSVRKMGLQLHYWTVNDPQEMLRLASFATGIVTDRVDLAPNSLRNL